MDEALNKIIEYIEVASPVVWAAARQQVNVQMWTSVMWGAAFVVIFFLIRKYISSHFTAAIDEIQDENTDEEVIILVRLLQGGILGAPIVGVLMNAHNFIQAFVNPDYVAIQAILKLAN